MTGRQRRMRLVDWVGVDGPPIAGAVDTWNQARRLGEGYAVADGRMVAGINNPTRRAGLPRERSSAMDGGEPHATAGINRPIVSNALQRRTNGMGGWGTTFNRPHAAEPTGKRLRSATKFRPILTGSNSQR